MSDEKTPIEEELIPVEAAPEEAPAPEEGDDEDDGDTRLATSDDDHEELASTTNNARRRKRREMQKRAREMQQLELQQLKQINAQLAQRVASIEGHTLATAEQTIEQKLLKATNDFQQAEYIMAQAINAGNGEDTIAAQRIRDEAMREAQQLLAARQQMQQARQQVAAPAPQQPDPHVATYAKEWMDANPWYKPDSGSEEAAVVKSIDSSLAREGFDPRSITYWQELTRRVGEVIGDDLPAKTRKGPPVGSQREHAPTSTRKEIYVTPERKQAMIEAGVWDDPQKRQRYLKAYQSYDSSSAR
jgi:hypothetical protein